MALKPFDPLAAAEPTNGVGDATTDLRAWIERVEAEGELRRISGAHWDKEIGALTELSARLHGNRVAMLFDDIPGYPKGYRVLSNAVGSASSLMTVMSTGSFRRNTIGGPGACARASTGGRSPS